MSDEIKDETIETPEETPKTEEKPVEEKPSEEKPIEPETRIPEESPKSDEPKDKSEPEVDPDDEKTIAKLVTKQLDPVQKRLEQQSNLIEATDFIASNPDFSKYKDAIIKHMNHPAYKNIPVDRIAKMIAGDDLIKIGAAREREAVAKVALTKGGGSSSRMAPGGKNWSTATKEEFEAQRASVLGRQGQ